MKSIDDITRSNRQVQLPHTFRKIARKATSGESIDKAIGMHGTLLVANESEGLRAYTDNGNSFINTAQNDKVL